MDTTTAVVLLIAANVVVMYLIKRRRDRLKHHLPMARLYHGSYLLIIVVLLGLIATRGNDASTQYQSALIAKTQNYRNIEWLGKPILQPVLDLWTLQETIYEVGPELLIECGTFRGGSSYFFAQLTSRWTAWEFDLQ